MSGGLVDVLTSHGDGQLLIRLCGGNQKQASQPDTTEMGFLLQEQNFLFKHTYPLKEGFHYLGGERRRQYRRNRVADLGKLPRVWPKELIVVREGLKPGALSNT